MARKPIQVFETCSGRNESGLPAIDSSSVVRGSDELRGENVPDRAWRTARSLRGLVHDTHRYLAGTAERSGFLPTGSRHSGAANAQHAILGFQYELAGHSPYGNRCSSVAGGGQFLAKPALESPVLFCGVACPYE